MGEQTANLVNVEQGGTLRIVLEAGLLTTATDALLELLHKLRIGVVARTRSPYTALDAHAEQGKVAQQVEQFVTSQLVVEAKLGEESALDLQAGLVEQALQVLQLLKLRQVR